MNLNDLKECQLCKRIKYLSEFYQVGVQTERRRSDNCKRCDNAAGEIDYQTRKALKK